MAPTANNLKIVFGGGAFMVPDGWTEEKLTELLDYLEKEGIDTIDSAEIYGESESMIGKSKAAARGFYIDTKVSGGLVPTVRATKETVIKSGEESLRKLAADQVDIYYIHAPDRQCPFKDTLEGIDELYKAGKFKRFGLSNFTAEEVEEVVRIAKENNFVVPSVYQGNYNAVGRLIETKLFPTLPGGFLTKTPEDITVHGKGRFDKSTGFSGQLYNSLYNTPVKLDFLAKFGKIASDDGISQAELAHRWVTYNSYLDADKGDAIIVGARFGSQLTATLEWLKKGPLSQETVDKLDEIWKGVEGEAILDNFNDFISKAGGLS
ncbi:hypothetical protein UA08_01880 [Talaromyces atroroseus]|uniref:NADP-dependent oxidoreductase domain-containing protein n=1 Tax=Talaromyces atroroseus TaxID=1441469 RepID=A0A1Q5QBD1_TALAT|nr:hypothetical protein UA08_01880 [Talaromyces atroroseus]OKL63191.1 hypothetical protein UA08_01880 [Talaromyces atroroseus]